MRALQGSRPVPAILVPLVLMLLAQLAAATGTVLGGTVADLASGALQEGADLVKSAREYAAGAWDETVSKTQQLRDDARTLAAQQAAFAAETLSRATDARVSSRTQAAQVSSDAKTSALSAAVAALRGTPDATADPVPAASIPVTAPAAPGAAVVPLAGLSSVVGEPMAQQVMAAIAAARNAPSRDSGVPAAPVVVAARGAAEGSSAPVAAPSTATAADAGLAAVAQPGFKNAVAAALSAAVAAVTVRVQTAAPL